MLSRATDVATTSGAHTRKQAAGEQQRPLKRQRLGKSAGQQRQQVSSAGLQLWYAQHCGQPTLGCVVA